MLDVRNFEFSLADIQGENEDRNLFDKLHVDFEILIGLQAIFSKFSRPSYEHYTKIGMVDREMRYYKYIMGKDRKNITCILQLGQ